MPSFFGRAIGKFRRHEDEAVEVHLAAFGKHPGWDDHIEDLGLDTEVLVGVRRVLYLQGIAGNIDAGAWEERGEDERLAGFHHLFVWRLGGDVVLGRMWSSRDGKGRTRFPMIVCAHCRHLPLRWALKEVLPRLEAIEQQCVATTEAAEVRAIIAGNDQALHQAAAAEEPIHDPVFASPRALARLAARPEMGPDHQGLHRIIYQMEREMPAFHLRASEVGTRAMSFRPHHMRVPLCAESREEAVQLWMSFLPSQLDRSTPTLLFLPLEEPWVDLVVGEPGVQQFFCVRASVEAIPLATEIPYTLDEAFAGRIERDVEASRRGESIAPEPAARPEPSPAARARPPEPEPRVGAVPAPSVPLGQRLRKSWWIVLLVLAILALAVGTSALLELLGQGPGAGQLLPGSWEGVDADAWRELCAAYNGWFARFLDESRGPRLQRWRQDPELSRLVVARLEAARSVVVDPRRIAGTPSVPVADLAESPPAGAKTPKAIAGTRKALEALRAVEQGIRQWPAAGDRGIAVLAETYADDRGWTRQAERLRAVVESIQPAPGLGIAKAIDAALAVKSQLAAIEALYAKIQGHRQRVQILGDQVARRLGRHVLAQTRACETLEAVEAKLGALEGLAGQIADSAEPVRSHKERIAQAAGEGFAQRFLECARPRLEGADALEALPVKLKLVQGLAPGIEARLKAVKAHHGAILDLGDQALADRLWDCALAETAGAHTLMALNERLEGVKTVAPKIAARRKAIAQHHQAIMGLGIATLERHGRHMARSIAEAKDMASLLEAVDQSADLLAKVAARWQAIEKLQKAIVASGDTILARFATYPPARVNAENNIATLPATLDEIHATTEQLAELVERDWTTGRIDRERFARESAVHRTFQGKVTDQTLEDWRTQVAHYYRLDAAADPRQPKALWDTTLRDIRWRIAFLADSGDPAKRRKGEQHARELAHLETRLADLRKLPWIKDNQARITQAAARLREDIDAQAAQLKDVIEPPALWLKRIRGLDRIADAQALNREWLTRRNDLVTDRVTPEALEGFRQVYTRLWRNVRTLRQFLAGLDDPEAMPRGLPEALARQPKSELLAAAARAVHARREQSLQAAIETIPWGDNKIPAVSLAEFKQRDAWRQAVAAYVGWRKDAARLLADFRRIEAALDAGYLLDDKPATLPESPARLYARWRDHKLLDSLRQPLQPVLERLADLEAIQGLPREKLVERMRRGGRPEAVLAAWLRLGHMDDWPRSVAELKLELAARDALREAAKAITGKDADRARWIEARLGGEGPRRWERAFSLLAARPSDDLRDEDIAAALQRLRAFGVEVEKLEPATRLRIYLYDLRDKAAALPGKAPREDVARVIDAFLTRVASLPGVAARKPVADLVGQLREIREQKVDDRPSVGLAKAGPMASPLASQWAAKVRDDGTAAAYTWRGKDHVLRFVRIEPANGAAKPAYLATTEVSVGLFTDAMGAADRWVEATALLRVYDPKYESLKGPRVWEWKRSGGGEIQVPRRWTAREIGRGQHYADGLDPGAPERHHPMQHVSPAAALYFAGLLGCRLPTAAEWRAAFEAHGTTQTPNLRDATWSRQLAYVRKKHTGGIPAQWPDAGIFWPPNVARKQHEAAVAVTTQDDGTLWFDAVGQPDRFRHLAGNVAEFVFERPEPFDERVRKGPGLKAAAVLAFAKEHAAALRVAGASALSPPALWDGKDKPFHHAWTVDVAASRDGYSDVGFRLAFTAPRESPAARLQRLLRASGYLSELGR